MMSVGTALIVLTVIAIIFWGLRKIAINRETARTLNRQTSIPVTQPQKKTMSILDATIKCVERNLEIIDESKNIINKSKNIDTILSRFAVIFMNTDRIKEYDTKCPGLGLRPPISEVEQFYKGEKERFLTNHVRERTDEIIGEMTSENGNSKKAKLAKEGYLLIDKVKKELLKNENISKLDEISNKIHEVSNIPIPQNDVDISDVKFKENRSFALREGKMVPTDDAFDAWTSRDLEKMLSAFRNKTNPVDRHFLLMGIVDETYKRRNDPEMRKKCKDIAEIHIKEFPTIVPPLKKDMGGVLPRVSTFQQYSTVLTEDGEFEKAIEVCKLAISYHLNDGTNSGFEGRIERIAKKMKEAEKK
jgi:hypothetical protein